MSDNCCIHELRIATVEKENAVMVERTEGIKEHVKSISNSVKLMQRLIIGFMITCALTVTGSILKDSFTGTNTAIASQEVSK